MREDKEFNKFLLAMKAFFEANRDEKGDSWRTCSLEFLKAKIREEVSEFYQENNSSISQKHEVVDIANICFMLWHRL